MRKEKRFARGIILLALLALLLTAGGAYALSDIPQGEDELLLIGYVPIRTVEDLKKFRDRVNDGEKTIKGQLLANLDLEGAEWEPIGTAAHSFAGDFYGGNHTVSNFKNVAGEGGGLFGLVGSAGSVRNVRVEKAVFSSSGSGIVANNFGMIAACSVSESTIAGNESHGGGIAGENHGTITNCTAAGCDVSVTGTYGNAGGIAGENRGTITNCTATGCDVLATSTYGNAGGIAGENRGTITNCTAAGCNVSATGRHGSAGGIAGWSNGTIMTCLVDGKIEGKASAGVGGNAGGAVGLVAGGRVSGVVIDGGTIGGGEDSGVGGLIGIMSPDATSGKIIVDNISVTGVVFELGTGSNAGGVVGVVNNDTEPQTIDFGNLSVADMTLATTEHNLTVGGVLARVYGDYAGDVLQPIIVQNANVGAINVSSTGENLFFGGLVAMGGGALEVTNAVVQGSAIESTGAGGMIGGAVGMAEGREETVFANIVVMGCNITASGTGTIAGAFAGLLGGIARENCAASGGQINDADTPMIGSGDDDPSDWLTMFNMDDIGTNLLPMLVAFLQQEHFMTVPKGERVTLRVEALPGTKDVDPSMFAWSSSSPDVVAIAATTADGMEITFEAKEVGESVVTCSVASTLLNATLTCNVTVVASGDSDPVWGGSNSNCNVAGAGLAILAAIPFVRRRRR